jgi:hypothetical protein
MARFREVPRNHDSDVILPTVTDVSDFSSDAGVGAEEEDEDEKHEVFSSVLSSFTKSHSF